MKTLELTNRAVAATSISMFWPMQTSRSRIRGSRRGIARSAVMTMAMGGALALGGCVSVNAPDKPIVIELNINIEQKVIYQLAADAANTIEENPGIF
jgi:hypothetical protein